MASGLELDVVGGITIDKYEIELNMGMRTEMGGFTSGN